MASGPGSHCSSSRLRPSRVTSAPAKANSRRSTFSSRRISACQVWVTATQVRHVRPHGLLQLQPDAQADADRADVAVLGCAHRPQQQDGGGGTTQRSSISPEAGGPGTRFTYSVNYTNTTKPTVHQVIVDGTAINMTPAQVVNSHETLYEATDTLSPGTHSYRFKFAAAGNSWQLPVNNVPFSGPQVAPFDLTNMSVSPFNVGEVGKPMTFGAVYKSPSGTAPTTADVVIDDVHHPMTKTGGSPSSGITYKFTTSSLFAGEHDLQFAFSDGTRLYTYYTDDAVAVNPIILTNSKVSPASGTKSTPFKFSTVYKGPDTASEVEVIVGGVAHRMSAVSGTPAIGVTYSTSITLPAGSHTFSFYATDGSSQWTDPRVPAVYTGLKVAAAGQAVPHSVIVGPRPAQWDNMYDAG